MGNWIIGFSLKKKKYNIYQASQIFMRQKRSFPVSSVQRAADKPSQNVDTHHILGDFQ